MVSCGCDYRVLASGALIGAVEHQAGVPFPAWALELVRFAVNNEHAAEVILFLLSPRSSYLTAQVLKLRHDIVGLVTRRWAAITGAQLAVSFSQFGILLVAMIAGARAALNYQEWRLDRPAATSHP